MKMITKRESEKKKYTQTRVYSVYNACVVRSTAGVLVPIKVMKSDVPDPIVLNVINDCLQKFTEISRSKINV